MRRFYVSLGQTLRETKMSRGFVSGVFFIIMLLVACLPAKAQEAPSYEIDTDHTRIIFYVDHLGFSAMPGFFNDIRGTLRFDPTDVAQSQVDVTINAKAITTGHRILDEKLRGPDYFNVAKYPVIRFRGTSIERTGMEDGMLTGNLTMLGVTRPVTLNVHFNKKGWNNFANANALGFSATGKVSRSEFGMKKMLPDIGNDVLLTISLEAYIPTLAMKLKKQAEAEEKRKAAEAAKEEKEAKAKEADAKKDGNVTPVKKAAPAPAAAPSNEVILQLPSATGGMKRDLKGSSPFGGAQE